MSYIDKLKVGNTLYDIRSELDTTLSVSGVPADAKVVGDEINAIIDRTIYTTDIAGYVDARNGNFGTGGNYKRTDYIPVDSEKITQYTGKIYYWAGIAGYDENKHYVRSILVADEGTSQTFENEVLTIGDDIAFIVATSLGTGEVTTYIDLIDGAESLKDDIQSTSEEVSEVKNVVYGTPTTHDLELTIVDGFVNTNNGNFGTGGNYKRTDYVPVDPTNTYYYSGRIFSYAGVYGYDSNYGKVGSILSRSTEGDAYTYVNEELTIPETVSYIVASTMSNSYPITITEEIPAKDIDERTDEKIEVAESRLSNQIESGDIERLPIYDHFSAFLNFSAIGDSLTFGLSPATYTSGGEVATWGGNNNCSWVRHLEVLTGASSRNLGVSGATARSWIASNDGYAKMINGKRTQAYIIGLGINDVISESYPAGELTDIDFSDYHNNADTFIGNYAGIIQRIMEFNTGAKVFVLGNPRANYNDGTVNNSKYLLLKQMCELTGFAGVAYFVDLYADWKKYYESEAIEKWRRGVHYSPPAYHHIARIMLSALSQRMTDDFKDFELIYTIPYDA